MTVSTSSVYALSSIVIAFPWAVTRPKEQQAGRILYTILAITLLFGLIFPALLGIEDRLAPWKFDEVLYQLDGALGASVVSLSKAMPRWLFVFFVVIYKSLLWVITLWAAVHISHSWGRFGQLVKAFAISYVTAGLLYMIVPACGPAFALSAFLGSPLLLRLSCEPNAMPSMHVASAFLLVLFAGPNRWFRAFSLFYLCATALGTVLVGEHYFIDWPPAIPLSFFAEAAVRRRFPRAAAYLSLTILWLLAIRLAGVGLIAHPVWLASLTVLTVLGGAGFVAAERQWRWEPRFAA